MNLSADSVNVWTIQGAAGLGRANISCCNYKGKVEKWLLKGGLRACFYPSNGWFKGVKQEYVTRLEMYLCSWRNLMESVNADESSSKKIDLTPTTSVEDTTK